MTRFKQGTLDHDGDGRMGGSMKGKVMAGKKKTAPRQSAEEKARVEQEQAALATAPDPQTGMARVNDEQPAAKEALAKRKEAIDAQFAAADAKGAPTADEVAEATLGRAIRGY